MLNAAFCVVSGKTSMADLMMFSARHTQIKRGHFSGVSDHKIPLRYRGMIPRPAIQNRKSGDFRVTFRGCAHQREVAVLGNHREMAGGTPSARKLRAVRYDVRTMQDVRLAVYDHILSTGRVPLVREIAARVSLPVEEVCERLRALQDIHAFALAPASDEILMAHPFSAVPTPYRVRAEGRAFWANCAWDAVAIPAMLGCDATVDAHCPDCLESITFDFSRGVLQSNSGVVHFHVEPRNFWRNVVYT